MEKMPRTVTLNGGGPWGFRLVGGVDFHSSLAISKVTPGGKAEGAGLKPGDIILLINSSETSKLTHLEAQNQVKSSKTILSLTVESPPEGKIPNSSAIKPLPTPNSKGRPSKNPPSGNIPPKTNRLWQPIRPKPPPPVSTANSIINDISSVLPAKDKPKQTISNKSNKLDDLSSAPNTPVSTPAQSNSSQETNSSPELICEGCKQQIRGPYLTAQGKNWHPHEFVCSSPSCKRPLQNCGFIEEKGQVFCAECYQKYFAHSCGKCHKKIVGEVMHALNQTWHVDCFVCTACAQPFRDGVFHLEHDKPYCVPDYNRLFSTKCKGCGFPIEAGDHYVEAIESQWHESCFACAVCHCDLKSSGFYAVNDKPVCSTHRNSLLPT